VKGSTVTCEREHSEILTFLIKRTPASTCFHSALMFKPHAQIYAFSLNICEPDSSVDPWNRLCTVNCLMEVWQKVEK